MIYGNEYNDIIDKILKKLEEALDQEKSESGIDLNSRYKKIFSSTNTNNINELVNLLDTLAKDAGLELNYNKIGIDINNNIDLILNGINEKRLKNNPINLSIQDVKNIIIKI